MGQLPRNNFSYIPFASVSIDDPFWSKRIEATHKNTLRAILSQLKSTGRWDVFRLVWKAGDPNPPHIFWDSYAYSLLEFSLTLVIPLSSLRRLAIPLSLKRIMNYIGKLKIRLSGYVRVNGTMDT